MKILVIDVGGTNVKVSLGGAEGAAQDPLGRGHDRRAHGGRGEEGDRADGSTTPSPSAIRGPVVNGRPAPGAREPGRGLGPLRLPEGLRQAGARGQRRRHAGARQLPGRAHAVPRPRHRPRLGPRGQRSRSSPWSSPTCPTATSEAYEDYVGLRGLKRLGKKKWRKHVARGRGAAEARAAGGLRHAGRRPDEVPEAAASRRAPRRRTPTPSWAASASGTSSSPGTRAGSREEASPSQAALRVASRRRSPSPSAPKAADASAS